MSLMSAEVASLGPLCQATIVTIQPFSMGVRLLLYGLVLSAVLKIFASIARAFLKFRSLSTTAQSSRALTKIATKHNFPLSRLTIINDHSLLAFASSLPWISNGIFVSLGACRRLSPRQLEAVFLHELHHWLRRDPLIQLSLKIATEVCFFIPSIRDLLHHWQLQAELQADAYVVKQLGSAAPLKKALSRWLTLTNVETTSLWAIAFAETQLGTRIRALSPQPDCTNSLVPRHHWLVMTRLVISVAVLTSFAFLQTTQFSQAKAQLIIPNSPQCTQAWQENAAQSSVFTVMSHQ